MRTILLLLAMTTPIAATTPGDYRRDDAKFAAYQERLKLRKDVAYKRRRIKMLKQRFPYRLELAQNCARGRYAQFDKYKIVEK